MSTFTIATAIGIFGGATLRKAYASVVCSAPYRYQMVELRDPQVEFLEEGGNPSVLEGEQVRWGTGVLEPESIQLPQGREPFMPVDDGVLRFAGGISGYDVRGHILLVPMEGS